MIDGLKVDDSIIIAGGGIAGLFAASVLLEKGFDNITIVERGDVVGGLLKSKIYPSPLGDMVPYSFDYGTHFVIKTGNENIDRVLDLDINEQEYYQYSNSLPEGQYINSKLYCDSGCANATLFSSEVFEKIESEISDLIKNQQPKCGDNLKELFLSKYGETATKNIYEPALEKFTGQNIEGLDTITETAFNSSRIILKGRQSSKKLKESSGWDDVVAYAHYLDGRSAIKKYYPKESGVDLWVKKIEARLILGGVRMLKLSEIETLYVDKKRIKTVKLGDKGNIDCDYLIWTLPPIFLSKMTDIKVPSRPPVFRSVSIINIITDTMPVKGPYWFTIYDPDIRSFRVTVYDNFTNKGSGRKYRLSVEVLHNNDFKGSAADQKSIFHELKTMNILPDDALLLWSCHELIPVGFPILKSGDVEIYEQQIDVLQQSLENLYIVNRYRNGSQGQSAIMQNIYDGINSLFRKVAA